MVNEPLSAYPYVVVRIGCHYCDRRGAYRLARLAAKFGPDIDIQDMLRRVAFDCSHWKPNSRWPEGCGAYYIDLEGPRPPPDLPPSGQGLRVVYSSEAEANESFDRTTRNLRNAFDKASKKPAKK